MTYGVSPRTSQIQKKADLADRCPPPSLDDYFSQTLQPRRRSRWWCNSKALRMVGELGERPWQTTPPWPNAQPRTVAQHQLTPLSALFSLVLIPIFHLDLCILLRLTIFLVLLPDPRAGHCRRPSSALGQSEVIQDGHDGSVFLSSQQSSTRNELFSIQGTAYLNHRLLPRERAERVGGPRSPKACLPDGPVGGQQQLGTKSPHLENRPSLRWL